MSKPPFLDLPPGVKNVRLETPRGVFAAYETDPTDAAATALLVPGFTGSKEDFIALLDPLATAGFHVVAVDGRGQYETPGTDSPAHYAQDELARDVIALATTTARANTATHLLGHSLGGLIARAAVIQDPGRFASLTLMSSGPAAISETQRARTKLLIDALATTDMEPVWQAMRALDPPEAADARTPTDVADFLHRRWLHTRPAQLITTGRQLITEPDRVSELGATGIPVHVLSGERDYAWPVPLLDAMAVRLKASRTRITGAEHSPNVDRPEETARALAAFWTDLGGHQ